MQRPLTLTDRSFHAAHCCLPVWDSESAAARILALEQTLKVIVSRASGAVQRAPNDKVHATTLDSRSFQDAVKSCCHQCLLISPRLASWWSAFACGVCMDGTGTV